MKPAAPVGRATPASSKRRTLSALRGAIKFLLLATIPALIAAAPRHASPSHASTPRAQAHQKFLQAERDRQAREAEALGAAQAANAARREADAMAEQRVRAATDLRRIEGAVLASGERVSEAADAQARAEAAWAGHQADFQRLLPLVLRLQRFPAETVLAVPGPPSQAIEGLLIARGLAAELNRQAGALRLARSEAERLRRELVLRRDGLAAERGRQEAAASVLDRQVTAAQGEAAQAEDRARQAAQQAAAVAAQATSLRGALAAMDAAAARNRTQQTAPEPAGPLAAPVAGRVTRPWGAPAEDGPATGITYATAPGAFVSSPCAGRVAFAAPFRSYGQLLIVTCGGGRDFVLAGLARLDAAAGHPVRAGEPVGRMAAGSPSLYVELRQNGKAMDPAPFLNTKG